MKCFFLSQYQYKHQMFNLLGIPLKHQMFKACQEQ
jgi:hypothetical protein